MIRRGARLRLLTSILLALVVPGCDGVQVAASLGPGGIGTGQSAAALVGRWFRVVEVRYFIDYAVEGTIPYLGGVPFLRAGA